MSDTRGIFTLSDIVEDALEGISASEGFDPTYPPELTSAGLPDFGYFADGIQPGAYVSGYITKLNYSTGTPSYVPSNVQHTPRDYFYMTAVSSHTHALFFGGHGDDLWHNTTRKFKKQYSTDTNTTVPGYSSYAGATAVGLSTKDKGYFTGVAYPRHPDGIPAGMLGGRYAYSSCYSVDHSTTTYTQHPSARLYGEYPSYGGKIKTAGTGNDTEGFVVCGHSRSTAYGDVDSGSVMKWVYATHTTTNPGVHVFPHRYDLGGAGTRDEGYFMGGWEDTPGQPTPGTSHNDVSKLVFSTGTRTPLPSTTLATPRYGMSVSGNDEKAFIVGGNDIAENEHMTFSLPSTYHGTEMLTYSTGTMAVVPSTNRNYYGVATGARIDVMNSYVPP